MCFILKKSQAADLLNVSSQQLIDASHHIPKSPQFGDQWDIDRLRAACKHFHEVGLEEFLAAADHEGLTCARYQIDIKLRQYAAILGIQL